MAFLMKVSHLFTTFHCNRGIFTPCWFVTSLVNILNEEIVANSRIEAVHGPGRCYMLPFVDHVIQLVLFAGWPGVLVNRAPKIPQNVKYRYSIMIFGRSHGTTVLH